MRINTYRNFCTFSYVTTSLWSMHTATFQFYLSYNFMLITGYRNFFFLLCYNFMLINAYRNFFTFSYVITWCWLMYIAIFPFLLCYNLFLICAYRNFSHFPYVIISCSSMPTSNLPFFLMFKLLAYQCILQRFHFLLCYNLMLIIAWRNFSFFYFVLT